MTATAARYKEIVPAGIYKHSKMKTIKLHEEEYVTLATGIELKEVPEYVKKDSLGQQFRRGYKSANWSWRKRTDSGEKRFTGTAKQG